VSTTADRTSTRETPVQAGRSHGAADAPAEAADARRRAGRHPISRWYIGPLADRLAAALTPTRVRPVHLTLCGLAVGAIAAAVLVGAPQLAPVAGLLVLVAWLFDRADGSLARRQGTVSAWGAWLDANVDELLDVGLHAALAAAAASQTASRLPWLLLGAFLAGKYLFVYGMATEEQVSRQLHGISGEAGWLGSSGASAQNATTGGRLRLTTSLPPGPGGSLRSTPATRRLVRAAYHLPGNADVRVHLLAAALMTGWLSAELAVVAGYYNLRWIVRYVLVARRLGGRR